MSQAAPLLLHTTAIEKSFAGVRALKGVSFDLRAGEVHAVVGENGAGKSTLIKIITGAEQPDGGTLTVSGRPVQHMDPATSRALGIAVIYQQPSLFPHLTVAENIALALEPGSPWRRVDWKQRHARAAELLARDRVRARSRATRRDAEHARAADRRNREGDRRRREDRADGRAHRVIE